MKNSLSNLTCAAAVHRASASVQVVKVREYFVQYAKTNAYHPCLRRDIIPALL